MSEMDCDEEGNVIVNPLVGFSIGTPYEMDCFLRLEYISSPEQSVDAPHGLQLVLSINQALDLSSKLAEAIARVQKSPPSGPTTN